MYLSSFEDDMQTEAVLNAFLKIDLTYLLKEVQESHGLGQT